MTDQLLKRHTDERAAKRQLIENYANAAAEENRDLTASEIETIGHARARIENLDLQIDAIGNDLQMSESMTEKLRQLDPTVVSAPTSYRTAGEMLFDVLHQGDRESRDRYSRAQKRAAEHLGTDKAKTVATAGDLGGLTVSPVSGPIIDPYPRGMPFASALGLIQAPNSLHFMRPIIKDANFATGVAAQTKEKEELASKAFEVDASPVALSTVGGYLNVSQQLQSLQAGSLDLIISHMNRRLANAIETTVVAGVTGTGATAISGATTAAGTLKAIYDAAAAYYAATNSLPTWIAMGPKGWARLGSLSDAAGRPMFPYLGAANADGSARASSFDMAGPAGLRSIVTPAIADAKLYVGGIDALEGYIYRYPVLEAVEPSVLGRQVAVAASIGVFEPIADSTQVIT